MATGESEIASIQEILIETMQNAGAVVACAECADGERGSPPECIANNISGPSALEKIGDGVTDSSWAAPDASPFRRARGFGPCLR
jgi:hypothetical protein